PTDASGSTRSSARTWFEVTPYARQCGPPALVFTLPPIELVCCEEGSGAYVNPEGASAVARSRFGSPGSTHARRSSGRTSRMRVIFEVTTTSASAIGVDAPASPVPEPRGTIGSPCSPAIRTHATTSSSERGKATSAQAPSTIEASRAYSARDRGSDSTSDGPSASSSARCAASTSAMACPQGYPHARRAGARSARGGRGAGRSGHAAGGAVGGREGEALALPLLHAALDVVGLEPASPEHQRGELAAVAAAADDRHRALGVEVARRSGHDGVQRDVEGALDASRRPLVRLAAVDQLNLVQPLVDAARRRELGLEVLGHRTPNPIRAVGYPPPPTRRPRARAGTRRTRPARERPGRAGRIAPPPPACARGGRRRSQRGRRGPPGTRTRQSRSRGTPRFGRRARRPHAGTRRGSSRAARRGPPTRRTRGPPCGSPTSPAGRRRWWRRPCRSADPPGSGCGGSPGTPPGSRGRPAGGSPR